jgi:hypothetical protein
MEWDAAYLLLGATAGFLAGIVRYRRWIGVGTGAAVVVRRATLSG